MKNNRKIRTRFEPEISFELKPSAAHFRAAEQDRFESLKIKLLREQLSAEFDPASCLRLRRAANEAAALAWVTPYPLLVFPALFEEKAETAVARAERQQTVFERSRELLTV